MKLMTVLIIILCGLNQAYSGENTDIKIIAQGSGNCVSADQHNSIVDGAEYLSVESIAVASANATLSAQLDCDGVLLRTRKSHWNFKIFHSYEFGRGTVICQLAEATFTCRR